RPELVEVAGLVDLGDVRLEIGQRHVELGHVVLLGLVVYVLDGVHAGAVAVAGGQTSRGVRHPAGTVRRRAGARPPGGPDGSGCPAPAPWRTTLLGWHIYSARTASR